MNKMGYGGRGLGANGQCIVNPVKVVELPRYVGLGYFREKVGECSKEAEARESSSDEFVQDESTSYDFDDLDYESSPKGGE
jgi:hypothetical protein